MADNLLTAPTRHVLANQRSNAFNRLVENFDPRLFKKVQMRGAREIDPSASLRTG